MEECAPRLEVAGQQLQELGDRLVREEVERAERLRAARRAQLSG